MEHKNRRKVSWKRANFPPKTNSGKWSKDVVVITNLGNVHLIAYFGSKNDGCWQRPIDFVKGEEVEYWIENPNDLKDY